MTVFTDSRRRHSKLAVAGLAAWAAAATGLAVYFAQTEHLPRVSVSTASPHAAASAPARGPVPASVPARRAGDGSPAAGQEAPSVPVIDLAGVSWQDSHGIPLPVSKEAGPFDTAHGLASGYADSPLGALLAAVNIAARTSWQFGPQVFGPTIARQVTGKFAAQMQSSDQNAWDQGAPESVAGTQGVREEGFSVEQYTPADATVDVLSGAPGQGNYAVTQIHVERAGGDWKVVAPPGGDWADSATQVQTADGFTAFPGQGG